MIRVVYVMIGGAAGAASRYWLSGLAQETLGTTFPWGTALVNVIGCFFIGLIMTVGTELAPMSTEARVFLVTGIIGGFTTFSAFAYETLRLLQDGGYWSAVGNVLLNVVVGLGAVWLGMTLARTLWS